MEQLAQVLRQIGDLPQMESPELNFYAVGGAGYLENPTSDLMALFMGAEPQAPRWLAKALLSCLANRGLAEGIIVESVDWDGVTAEREVAQTDQESDSVKRLDLVISDGDFVLGIENKVYATARGNPFHVYDRLLAERAAGGPIIKCVLRPTDRTSDVPLGWPVVTYPDLVKTALDLLGQEFVRAPVSKWHFFYREFLNHLESLANPESGTIMSDAAFSFALKNFHALSQAADLLGEFKSQLEHDATARVRERLSAMTLEGSVALTSKQQVWRSLNQHVVEIYPASWGKYSKVVLAYGEDETDEDHALYFYVLGYISFGTEKQSIEEIKQRFYADTKNEVSSWRTHSDPADNLFEEGRSTKYLGISGMPKDATLSGALQALEDLAAWMQQFVFTPAQ
ncbi:PD-(D/E)XK nuclease superfamily protein [Cupriavidus metallidurans]|jgi:PD-(D/E)XK nuclease superfamily|nr:MULTISPECIES: PD-(D/E)XK nuclease family protein [Cupriavidus]AZG11955.1 hypothetical protein EHF44_00240 [Cupriavidus pauculus]KAB0600868.1 hypothetical protein F7R19_19585 [Cupriavidus pauculus]MDE4922443.1 PD-(D/E)XK nuclease family protein [Cupriavidus metallidurans]MWL91897.1 hypothetical protein [Cupriavidus sp. SW-Y-13]QBP14583.1 hypothetical protein DDF84_033375 [Cupriavidus metallidurans]